MGRKTKIDWCDSTWNPVTGCLHGCEYCYARKIAKRFEGGCEFSAHGKFLSDHNEIIHVVDDPGKMMNRRKAAYPFGFSPTLRRDRLDIPVHWTNPRNIFVCSMADLFGSWVPDEWIQEVFAASEKAPQHRYLFLTKNPTRFGKINGWDHRYTYSYTKKNMWFGTSITKTLDLTNIRELPCGSANTFISIEPIIERIDLESIMPPLDAKWKCSYCDHYAVSYSTKCRACGKVGGYSASFRMKPMNWIIVGAETGNRKNKTIPQKEWIDHIAKTARNRGIPVFMKESLRSIMGDDFKQEFPWE